VAISFVNGSRDTAIPAREDRRVRVLFSSTPGEGHVRPLLPLARALAARGHELAFATGAEWAPRLEEEGFPVFPAGIDVSAARAFVDPEEQRRVAPADVRLFLFPRIFGRGQAPAKVPPLLEHARAWKPQAIVHESSDLAAPIVAAALGLPSVNHSFGTMVPLRVLAAAAEVVAPLWREHGLEPDPHAGAFRGLYVDVAPPSLGTAEPQGPSVRLRPAERTASPAPPPAGVETPFVYATMGTIFNEPRSFRILFEALDALAAVVTTGRGAAAPVAPPDGVVVAEFLPQEHVLPHARAVVFHGGSGTMLGALAHGLPLVVLPQGADQFDNADVCEAAGAAVVVRPDELDARAVRGALERVLGDESFAGAARALEAEIASMPPVDDVAERVEAYMAAG
jgi:UDP:flavonoid glycosyltransferase YjiC (YdhE family)